MIRARIGSMRREYGGELEAYFSSFRTGIIGNGHKMKTPVGEKKIRYADWTASGRLYEPIEKRIAEKIGPFMANTHTESNTTSSFMTAAYNKARNIIKSHVHAGEEDVLIMDGFGMTSVMNKFQRILGLRGPEMWKARMFLPEAERPVVFITHMEHHSNHTSWQETIADVVIVPPDPNGNVSPRNLETLLEQYRHRKWKIGSFTACSNVTGIIAPFHELAKVMHKYEGICVVDFAAGAPYLTMDMHPPDPLEKLDAILFSPHKFLGGPGTSGVLIFDKNLYHNKVPDHPGGGTVKWTDPWGGHAYIEDIETREDGGTPGILQAIRTALCIRLKEKMGVKQIMEREQEMVALLLGELADVPQVHILEGEKRHRIGIVSFCIRDLHYNLVVKLLNDRFGFQVRGGCSCAGTYGHFLFDIDEAASKSITDKISAGDLSGKPGWIRFSMHPTMTNGEIYEFVDALKLIIRHQEEWKREYVYCASCNDYFYLTREKRDVDELYDI
ncbi:aminotransferase class V-fold PLP-dependent enzyme [Bacillus tianshenii]|uniref:aminotransferase class V-fold PLP-dependent enzyme n=1 Tax=Sutcliffiella tianshenii TaxID=1463404 RepID=UPI001CD30F80|nr:aminotransferase class V-fold PLP-dependent enzyme [Bacillus tianshenii]MCA1322481.1 aminotransferase class V-fold PLP-dependent enzyme [Bacillus tianshenii]